MARRLFISVVLAGALIAAIFVAMDELTAADESVEPETPSFAEVERRDLIETITWDGVLSYTNSVELTHRSSLGILTWLAEPGSIIEPGGILYRVDDQPVVLLDGERPLWRSLDDNSEGDDVESIESALVALGYDEDGTVTIDTDYTANTAAMVERFQAGVGQDVTGEISLGTVLMAAGPIRVGEQLAAVGTQLSDGVAIGEISATDRQASFGVDPNTRGSIAIGDQVEIRLPDRSTVTANVVSISPSVDIDSGAYTALASLSSSNGYESDQLEVAVVADITLFQDALTVAPNALVALEGAQYQLKVLTDGGVQLINVEVLGKSGRYVAIAATGIDDGTIVVTP